MNYKEEINEIKNFLCDSLQEDWMNHDDKQELRLSINEIIDDDKLSSDLDKGVENGYSIETQMILVKSYFKRKLMRL